MQSFASARASFNFFELVNAKQRLLRSADIVSLFDGGVNSIARLQYLAIKSNSFSLYSSFPLFSHNVACLICHKKKSLKLVRPIFVNQNCASIDYESTCPCLAISSCSLSLPFCGFYNRWRFNRALTCYGKGSIT